MKSIKDVTMYVSFGGCYAYMTVTLYEGKTVNECIKIRCNDADAFLSEYGWVNI